MAFLAAVAAGGVIEVIQPQLGRTAEWRDLRSDAIGAVAGLAIHAATIGGADWRRWLAITVATAVAVPVVWPVAHATLAYLVRMSRFPVIFEGASHADGYFIHVQNASSHPELLPAAWARSGDTPSLRVRIAGGPWPGIRHLEPSPDWSGYSLLKLDLTNADELPLTLTLRIHDRAHDNRAADRFNRSFELAPRSRIVWAVPLREIAEAPDGRVLDLSRVAGLILFSSGDSEEIGREYYVTRIWLD